MWLAADLASSVSSGAWWPPRTRYAALGCVACGCCLCGEELRSCLVETALSPWRPLHLEGLKGEFWDLGVPGSDWVPVLALTFPGSAAMMDCLESLSRWSTLESTAWLSNPCRGGRPCSGKEAPAATDGRCDMLLRLHCVIEGGKWHDCALYWELCQLLGCADGAALDVVFGGACLSVEVEFVSYEHVSAWLGAKDEVLRNMPKIGIPVYHSG